MSARIWARQRTDGIRRQSHPRRVEIVFDARRQFRRLLRVPGLACSYELERKKMLETIAVVLVVLWILGLVTSYTMGGFIHILVALAVIAVLFRLIQGRRVWRYVAYRANRDVASNPGGINRPTGLHAASKTFNFQRQTIMNATKISGLVLLGAGILSLAYGSFSFTKETHKATVGPVELAVKDRETVVVPTWASVGAILIGGVLALGAIGKR
jgi:Family of unknown function (DUF5670)